MNNSIKRLVAMGVIVTTLCGTSLVIRDYNSQYSHIKAGISKLQEIGQHWKDQYTNLLNDMNDVEGALAQVKLKLESIYQTITGTEYDEATMGDIMDFDFSTIIKDQSYNNNLDAEAICQILGIPVDSSDETIIAKIEELINQVKSLENQILEMEEDEATLVEQLTQFKQDLDEALAEADAKIDQANTEDLAVIDDLNNSLESLGSDYRVTPNGVVDDGESNPDQSEPEQPVNQVTEEQVAEAKAVLESAITDLGNSSLTSIRGLVYNGTATMYIDNINQVQCKEGSSIINLGTSDKAMAVYNAWVTYYELYTQYQAQQQ